MHPTVSQQVPEVRLCPNRHPLHITTTPFPLSFQCLSRELISAEEGKLSVSRSLLDLKLEHSKLLERFESDRYALTTDLLAAKNEVVELEMG